MSGLSDLKACVFTFLIGLLSVQPVYSDCKLCEKIREENAKKINPYEYYEDYLEAEKQERDGSEIEFSEDEVQQKKAAE
ncbi:MULTISPECIES: hypothetical protein [Parachlamydia]|jgi:hypothetical protein|uniref:hypothetical protein n=1 Tax=Parachlamydia TaxID=83551 RepID=UPI0001C17CA2|nr:hypothetical protein [Parachlamydia acanthamoebae]EFB42087.1 hypothetical protein pah_c016o161 [Parachlamydia acanthamoebae str. Hall's coccus]